MRFTLPIAILIAIGVFTVVCVVEQKNVPAARHPGSEEELQKTRQELMRTKAALGQAQAQIALANERLKQAQEDVAKLKDEVLLWKFKNGETIERVNQIRATQSHSGNPPTTSHDLLNPYLTSP